MIEKQLHSISPTVLSLHCSCPKCDSINCFAKRSTKAPCTCVKCENSKICLYYSNKDNMKESKSDLNVSFENSQMVNVKKNSKNELVDDDLTYDVTKGMKKECIPKKTQKYLNKADTYTNNFCIKDYRPNVKVQSVFDTQSRRNINPAIANLSAQIMNVSYDNFKNSISADGPNPTDKHMLTTKDILQRLKEIYQACSCKVCDCIVGKSTRNTFCGCIGSLSDAVDKKYKVVENKLDNLQNCACKPCGCVNYTSSSTKSCSCKPCDCINYTEKLTEACKCQPCDCIKCPDMYSESCKCSPCQCIECKAMSVHLANTLIVAPTLAYYQRNTSMCQCSPCDCIHCDQRNGMSSSLMHEMSTGINRNSFCHCEVCHNDACEPDGSDSCKCQRRNKITIKPVERDVHDYDIRTIITKKYSQRLGEKETLSKSDADTIAMFAALPNVYPKSDKSKKICNCGDWDCLYCSCEKYSISYTDYSQPQKVSVSPQSNPYEYSSCENKADFKNTVDKGMPSKPSLDFWKCEISNYCDYNNSMNGSCKTNSSLKLASISSSQEFYKGDSGSCLFCRTDMPDTLDTKCRYKGCINHFGKLIFPTEKGKLITPLILNEIENNNENLTLKTNKLVSDSALIQNNEQKAFQKCYPEKQIKEFSHKNTLISHNFTQTKNNSLNFNKQGNLNDMTTLLHSTNMKNYIRHHKYQTKVFKKSPTSKTCSKDSYTAAYFQVSNDFLASSNNESGPDLSNYLISLPNQLHVIKLSPTTQQTSHSIGTQNEADDVKQCNRQHRKNIDDLLNYKSIYNMMTPNIFKQEEMRMNMKELNNQQLEDQFYTVINNTVHYNSSKVNKFDPKQIKINAPLNENEKPKTSKVNHVVDYTYKLLDSKNLDKSIPINSTCKIQSREIATHPHQNPEKLEVANHMSDFILSKTFSATESKQLKSSYVKNIDNLLNICSSYKSSKSTLRKAKVNNFQLLKMLKKFEQANIEYKNSSQKSSYISVMNNNLKFTKENTRNTETVAVKGSNDKILQRNRDLVEVSKELTCTDSKQATITKLHRELKTNPEKIIDKQMDESISNDIKTKYLRQFIKYMKNQRQKTSTHENPHNFDMMTKFINLALLFINFNDKLLTNSRLRKNASVPFRKKTYDKRLSQLVKLSKNISLVRKTKIVSKAGAGGGIDENVKTSNTINDIEFSIKREDKISKKTDSEIIGEITYKNQASTISISLNSTKVPASIMSDERGKKGRHDLNITEPSKDKEEFHDVGCWSIFKKNLYLEPTCMKKKKENCTFPSLYIEYKEAVHSISLQTNMVANNVTPSLCQNENLSNSNRQVDDVMDFKSHLVDDAMRRANIETPVNTASHFASIQDRKSSCDGMRVSSLNLRRVSDHTVVVMWEVPPVTADVEGYEGMATSLHLMVGEVQSQIDNIYQEVKKINQSAIASVSPVYHASSEERSVNKATRLQERLVRGSIT